VYRVIDDIPAFLIIPVTKNNPSTGTDEALWMRHTRANIIIIIIIDENKLNGYDHMMLSLCSQGPAGCRAAEQH